VLLTELFLAAAEAFFTHHSGKLVTIARSTAVAAPFVDLAQET